MTRTTIRDKGKNIPYAEWITRKAKELRIKWELADTPEKRAAVNDEIRKTRHFMEFVKHPGCAAGIECCIKSC